MTRCVELIQVTFEEKSILRQLIEFYEYDFSEFSGQDVNPFGYYGYRYFDHYWTEEGRHPFFIKYDRQYAGFVLVNEHCYLAKGKGSRSIAEFFVMRKYRRRGIGSVAAKLVFDRFRGSWEVLQHGNNDTSSAFWRKVIHAYTEGEYTIHDVVTENWKGQGIVFRNN